MLSIPVLKNTLFSPKTEVFFTVAFQTGPQFNYTGFRYPFLFSIFSFSPPLGSGTNLPYSIPLVDPAPILSSLPPFLPLSLPVQHFSSHVGLLSTPYHRPRSNKPNSKSGKRRRKIILRTHIRLHPSLLATNFPHTREFRDTLPCHFRPYLRHFAFSFSNPPLHPVGRLR